MLLNSRRLLLKSNTSDNNSSNSDRFNVSVTIGYYDLLGFNNGTGYYGFYNGRTGSITDANTDWFYIDYSSSADATFRMRWLYTDIGKVIFPELNNLTYTSTHNFSQDWSTSQWYDGFSVYDLYGTDLCNYFINNVGNTIPVIYDFS